MNTSLEAPEIQEEERLESEGATESEDSIEAFFDGYQLKEDIRVVLTPVMLTGTKL